MSSSIILHNNLPRKLSSNVFWTCVRCVLLKKRTAQVRSQPAASSYRTGTSPSPLNPGCILSDLGADSMISSAQLLTCPVLPLEPLGRVNPAGACAIHAPKRNDWMISLRHTPTLGASRCHHERTDTLILYYYIKVNMQFYYKWIDGLKQMLLHMVHIMQQWTETI